MTPQLQAAIAAIQPLSPTERRQLLQILIQSDSVLGSQTDLRTLSTQFWQGSPLQQLHATQIPKTPKLLKLSITSRISRLTFGQQKILLKTF